MKRWIFLFAVLSQSLFAFTPQSKQELCSLKKVDFLDMLHEQKNTMGFNNDGGLFNLPTGVCWWHSQFLRAATYLAFYSPGKKRWNLKTKHGVRKLKKALRKIIHGKKIVEIPGFKNLFEFSKEPRVEKVLQKMLQSWMGRDSLYKLRWIRGLEGHFNNGKEKWFERQEKEIEKIYHSVYEKNEIAYVMLQYKGVYSHAFLVFDIQKEGQFYKIKVHDSNYQAMSYVVNGRRRYRTPVHLEYIWKGDGWYSPYGTKQEFLLYHQKDRELKKILKHKRKDCDRA